MTLFADPFAGFVVAGLSLGVVGGVAVGFATAGLATAWRRSGRRWLRRSGGLAGKSTGPVRCIRCKRTVCPACRRLI